MIERYLWSISLQVDNSTMGSQLKNSFTLHVSAQIIFDILKNTVEANFKNEEKCPASYFFFKSPEATYKYFILGLIFVDMLLLTAFFVLSYFLGPVCTGYCHISRRRHQFLHHVNLYLSQIQKRPIHTF